MVGTEMMLSEAGKKKKRKGGKNKVFNKTELAKHTTCDSRALPDELDIPCPQCTTGTI